MTVPMLHYIYDPLCGWCYAAAPLVAAVRQAGIALNLHGGGLFPQPTRVAPEKAAYMRTADARIAELTGQTFGKAYLDRLAETTFWSVPPIAAVLAADRATAGAGPDILAAIQRAHYVDGRAVVERETLVSIAAETGLDARAFDLAFEPDGVGNHLARTHELMRGAGLQGFPGFLIERAGRLVRLPHDGFYGRPAEFVQVVKQAAGVDA